MTEQQTDVERILDALESINNRLRHISDTLTLVLEVRTKAREGAGTAPLRDWTGEGQRQVDAGEFKPE